MPKKRYNAEEIIHKLREADVLLAQGRTVSEVCKALGVTDQTYCRWRKQCSGMGADQLRELKGLQKENERPRRAVSDLTLDKLILTEARRETSKPRPPSGLHRPCAWQVPGV